jgi:hypothetical protein
MGPMRRPAGLRKLTLKSAKSVYLIWRMSRSFAIVDATVGGVGLTQLFEQPDVLRTQLSRLTAGTYQLVRKDWYHAAQLFQSADRLDAVGVRPNSELRILDLSLQGGGAAVRDGLFGWH